MNNDDPTERNSSKDSPLSARAQALLAAVPLIAGVLQPAVARAETGTAATTTSATRFTERLSTWRVLAEFKAEVAKDAALQREVFDDPTKAAEILERRLTAALTADGFPAAEVKAELETFARVMGEIQQLAPADRSRLFDLVMKTPVSRACSLALVCAVAVAVATKVANANINTNANAVANANAFANANTVGFTSAPRQDFDVQLDPAVLKERGFEECMRQLRLSPERQRTLIRTIASSPTVTEPSTNVFSYRDQVIEVTSTYDPATKTIRVTRVQGTPAICPPPA